MGESLLSKSPVIAEIAGVLHFLDELCRQSGLFLILEYRTYMRSCHIFTSMVPR